MESNETNRKFETKSGVSPLALRRRRVSLFRKILTFSLTAAALIFFVFWYRTIPQGMDCLRMTQRVANALQTYRSDHHKLPPILDVLDVRKGRYSIDHYGYWFAGLGGPEFLPSGTIIAYCNTPHEPMFSDPWRNVILMVDGRIVTTRLSEEEFQAAIKKQFPAERYFNFRMKLQTEHVPAITP